VTYSRGRGPASLEQSTAAGTSFRRVRAREPVTSTPDGDGGSLTTEYPANGSFFRPHTRSVHETDAAGSSPEEGAALVRVSYGQATKGVR
jgi:hypothetical protein